MDVLSEGASRLKSKLEYSELAELGGNSPIIERLTGYIRSNVAQNRVPLLIGQSAVGKSAIVKQIAEDNGFRMVDIRTAFKSRLDFEGLTERTVLNGREVSYNCPMVEIVEATDEWQSVCGEIAEYLRSIRTLLGDDELGDIDAAIERFEEGAKPAALFFDEITRGERSVRQVLTKILLEKEFMGLDITRSRIFAATNGVADGEEFPEDVYLTKDIDDVAFFDRFESIQVSVQSAIQYWMEWANAEVGGRRNIHPKIMEYIDADNDRAYSTATVLDIYESTGDSSDLASRVYPNFRTWEMLSSYLYAIDGGPVDRRVVECLLGESDAAPFLEFLGGFFDIVPNGHNGMSDVVYNSIKYNIPALLVGPSSIGKTSRVRETCRALGCDLVQVNLSQQDRTDLSGPPVKVNIEDYILGGLELPEMYSPKRHIQKLIEMSRLPRMVTIRAPKVDMVERLERNRESGRKTVIYYDEINRVQNVSVMSSVFEAISDNRAFGIPFDPDFVTVIAACNLGDEFGDAKDLDPAIANRFMVYRADGYTMDDVESYLEYARGAGFDPMVLSYLDKYLEREDVLKLITSIERRTISTSAASTRGIEDLSGYLKDSEHNGCLDGAVLFATLDERTQASNYIRNPTFGQFAEISERIGGIIDRWAAARVSDVFEYGDARYSVSDLVDVFKWVRDNFKDNGFNYQNMSVCKNLIRALSAVDLEVVMRRKAIFQMFLGEGERSFSDYYNKHSGREVRYISIDEIAEDSSLIEPFLSQEFSNQTNIGNLESAAMDILRKVAEEYPEPEPAFAAEVFTRITDRMLNVDMIMSFWENLVNSKELIGFVYRAESSSPSYADDMLGKVGCGRVGAKKGKRPVVIA